MKFRELKGDLFAASDNLAHCVSEDFHMSAGIAVQFKRKFGRQAQLREEGWRIGEVARTKEGPHYVFYLITKPRYFMKPTYKCLWATLVQLAKWVELLSLKSLSIPRISCVRDRLDWAIVREMIMEAFSGLEIQITVYY